MADVSGSGEYTVESGEYVRDTPLPSTGLFEGVDVDVMLELTRATIEARRPEVPDYEALLDKPVQAITKDGKAVRGMLRAHERTECGVMLMSFNDMGGQWQPWASLCELAFDELTRKELVAWHEGDPLGYFKAGYAWARDNQET